MNVKDMQGTSRGCMHADSHTRMLCGRSRALYPLHAASDIDSCMTNRAWMLQYDEPHVRGHHVDFGSEFEVDLDEDE